MTVPFRLECIACGTEYPGLELRYRCDCGALLDVVHPLAEVDFGLWDARRASRDRRDRSGVWRFREHIADLPDEHIAARGEGNTGLYESSRVASFCGMDALALKHEGENPTGSFKDRGMTVAISVARALGMRAVACASTGNTSASMASYAALFGLDAFVFVPDGKISAGKLAQSLAYGARTLQIRGDFDAAMRLVQEVCAKEGIYLVNSINPFRLEGQKAIAFELLQDLAWEVPDWIAVPGGNLGNNAAIGKALVELYFVGAIPRLPRLAVIQAAGAAPLYAAWCGGTPLVPVKAETIASAIRIGDPVSTPKSLRAIKAMNGVVASVTDQEILDAKAQVDAAGIGAEPASCATVAGIKKLVADGVIRPDERVVGILTGHVLKDPDTVAGYHMGTLDGFSSPFANRPVVVDGTLEAVIRQLRA